MPEEHIKEYVALNDDDLAGIACGGDAVALGELIKRMSSVVDYMAYALSGYGIEKADLVQEGMIGLLGAVSGYNLKSKSKASFRTYAKACISNRMITQVRKLSQKKRIPADKIVSIDENIKSSSAADPEESFIEKERESDLNKKIESLLSAYEYAVLNMYLGGYSYREIGNTLSKSEKSVANTMCRLKRKLKVIDNRL